MVRPIARCRACAIPLATRFAAIAAFTKCRHNRGAYNQRANILFFSARFSACTIRRSPPPIRNVRLRSPGQEATHGDRKLPRTSASSSCSSGAGPATHDSPPSGSSRTELAYRRAAPRQRAARTTGAARPPALRVQEPRAWTQRGAAPANAKSRRPLLRSGRRLPRQQRRAGSGGRTRARGKSRGACGGVDCAARLGISSWPRVAEASDGRDDGGVDRQLRTVPERQPVGDDLDPARKHL